MASLAAIRKNLVETVIAVIGLTTGPDLLRIVRATRLARLAFVLAPAPSLTGHVADGLVHTTGFVETAP